MADDVLPELPPELQSILERHRLTATPTLRIERWLEQVEARCNASLSIVEKQWPSLQKAVDAAKSALDKAEATARTSKTKRSQRAAESVSRKYYAAVNAMRPDAWWLSREAMNNASLVREYLAAGKADEAVEAALRTVNATWKLQGKRIEKQLKAAAKGYVSWSNGGLKRAATIRKELADRNRSIAHARDTFMKTGETSFPRIVSILAERFRLNKRTIKRILASMDIC